MPSLTDRFWAKVNRSGDCWIWTGALTKGYGRFNIAGRSVPAHQVAYELEVGEIPAGLVLDHTCRNTACVRPSHLEPVTNQENILRGKRGRMVTHCAQGHEYSEENTYRRPGNGRRMCLRCSRERRRRSRA